MQIPRFRCLYHLRIFTHRYDFAGLHRKDKCSCDHGTYVVDSPVVGCGPCKGDGGVGNGFPPECGLGVDDYSIYDLTSFQLVESKSSSCRFILGAWFGAQLRDVHSERRKSSLGSW